VDFTAPTGDLVLTRWAFEGGGADMLSPVGELARVHEGEVYDMRTYQRLLPPPGRKFHPSLARFAPDGRFVASDTRAGFGVIDTRADKVVPTRTDWAGTARAGHLPGFGLATAVRENGTRTWEAPELRVLPAADKLDLPPDLLELWARVAVRGELDAEGRFVKWDEPTWERKRQELAAKPAPSADVPFPGHVATDRLHWLRREFEEATDDADKFRHARDLLRRAEAAGDRTEAVRWRVYVASRTPEVAPPPRLGKP
jgi:hypothetical protein